MKRALIALVAITLLLTGCAAPHSEEGTAPGNPTEDNSEYPEHYNTAEKKGVEEFLVTLSDGRVVTCLFQTFAGALSCDWEHATEDVFG